MKKCILAIVLSATIQSAAEGTKDCFAPKSIDSECKTVTSDVTFQDYKQKQTQVLLDQKTAKSETVVVNASGKSIVLFDEDKAYTIKIADVDKAADGQILSLAIATRTASGIPDQKFYNSRSLTFVLRQGNVTSARVDSSFILHMLSEKAMDGKSLKFDPTTPTSAIMTSDFSGLKETLKDGTEIITFANSGIDIDLKNGYVLKSFNMSGTNKPTQVRQFANLLGEKVQDAINSFVNRHVAVLQMRKELMACKTTAVIANCTNLEAEVHNADMDRDHHFLSMIQESDLKIRSAPARPTESVPYVEVGQRCPQPPKTQFPNSIRYYYYYNLNGDCVAVSSFWPPRG